MIDTVVGRRGGGGASGRERSYLSAYLNSGHKLNKVHCPIPILGPNNRSHSNAVRASARGQREREREREREMDGWNEAGRMRAAVPGQRPALAPSFPGL